MKRILCFYVLLISNLIISQEKKGATSSFVVTDDVSITSQPKFYRSYFSEYNLNENWFFRMEMQERSNSNIINSSTLIEYPLLAKYHISNKFSALFEPSINVLRVNGFTDDVSLFSNIGFQYNITEDLLVDGRVNLNLTKTAPSNSINYGVSEYVLYKVGAKFKF